MSPMGTILGIILAVLVGAFAIAALIFLIGKIFGITFWVLGSIFRFIGAEVTDFVRFISSILASLLFAPMVVLSIVIGRWSASKHYAGSLMDELRGAGRCVYRFFVGNPARLVGLGGALEGVERRVPEAMAAAPTRDKPSKKRVGMFDGYKIIGSLKSGGSGGKLYIAEPDEIKRAVFAKRKLAEVDQVVIKVFSLSDGSSLPQIVRESRALDAARQLGLVLEHEMSPERFYYVMRYVPGEPLSAVTQRLHTIAPSDGLGEDELAQAMGYIEDLLVALDTYHNAELWHKDVKPDNIIVDGREKGARAHLVDFGLVTPMRSAMTLTTHGTEYFRDPELVRQALRGVKVHQIDGSKFDVYAAGAVLYSMIENSFPAHGGLSQITKRCPEALRWIVRRAMAEYDRRYPSAAAMLADLRVVMEASNPYALKPIDLPSVADGDDAAEDLVDTIPAPEWDDSVQPDFARAASPVPPRVKPARGHGDRVGRPQTQTDFWSGRYRVVGVPVATPKHAPRPPKPAASAHRAPPLRDPTDRRPAREQIKSARARAQQRRENAAKRINSARSRRRGGKGDYSNTPGAAVVFAGLLGMAVLFAGGVIGYGLLQGDLLRDQRRVSSNASVPAPQVSPPGIPAAPGSQRATASAAPAPSLPQVEAQLLIVPMLPQPIDTGLSDEMLAAGELMQAQGADLLGSVVPEDEEDQAIELIAQLRNALGSTPSDAPQYLLKVQEWLGTQTIDGVLILRPNPNDRSLNRILLVTQNFHTDLPMDEQTVPRLLGVLASNGYTPG